MTERSRGMVVLFTGPTGAGKSTCAETWAGSRNRPTVWFDHDLVRQQQRSGRVSRRAARADPSLRVAADNQWITAAEACAAAAAAYVSRGYDVALSAFRAPPTSDWMQCWNALDTLSPLIVVLTPRIEIALARDAGRQGTAHCGKETVHRAYTCAWRDWERHGALVIDNSGMAPSEVAAQVEAMLDSSDPWRS